MHSRNNTLNIFTDYVIVCYNRHIGKRDSSPRGSGIYYLEGIMSKENELLCDNCISREICILRGSPCSGYNDVVVFRSLLKMIAPQVNWKGVFELLEEKRDSNN